MDLDYYTPPRRARPLERWWRLDPRSPWTPALAAAALVVIQLLDIRFGSGGEAGLLLFVLVPPLTGWYLWLRVFGRRREGAFRPPWWLTLLRVPAALLVTRSLLGCVELWHRYYFTPGAWRMWWHPWVDLAPMLQLFIASAAAMLGLDLAELWLRLRHRRRGGSSP